MHRRRGKLVILKRHVPVRPAATASKQAFNRAPIAWEPPAPVSAVGSCAPPPGIRKWAPPLSKWAKPDSPLPTTEPRASTSSVPQPRPYVTRGTRNRPSPSFTSPPPSDKWGSPSSSLSHSLGKWARATPPTPTTANSISSVPTWERDAVPHTTRVPAEELYKSPLRQREIGETERLSRTAFTAPPAGEENHANRRRDKKFKQRGSLLSRLDEDVSIPYRPRVHDARISTKPRLHKSNKPIKINPDVSIPSMVSVGNLARLLNVRLDRLQRVMVKAGMHDEASYDHVLTAEYASLIAMEFNRNPIVNDEAAFDIYPPSPHAESTTLPLRPPIVTIMGHVDHGKTTLLDTLRSSAVAKGEAGGITQHIGAFSVPVANAGDGPRTITFLDTPGHAAFSAMRARGASVTDIVVLVVSADDGIMPQTREVLRLIEQEKLSAVVAINKVDKPGVDVENVQMALLAEGVQLEVFGGDVPSVPVSGLTGQGLDQLVETISAVAETQDLRAEQQGNIQGYTLESNMRKGLGIVATVLILRGCLKPGAHIICGTSHGKVRVMLDSKGHTVKAAYPGMAVTVTGWKTLPNAGDEVLEGTESDVKKAVANRLRKAELESTLGDVEAINEQRKLERERKEGEQSVDEASSEASVEASGPKELRLVIKGDVSGSVEAVVDALQVIGNQDACVKVVTSGVGDVTESDVLRAQAAKATVVAFSVSTPRSVEVTASQNQVPVISSNVIYTLLDDVRARVVDLLPPIFETKVTGEATVLQLFDIQLKGKQTKKVAGCRVINGIVDKSKEVRVVRDHKAIYEGHLDTLRHLRKDITEAGKGLECGISISGFSDLHEGDLIQVFDKIEKAGIL